MRQLIIFEWKKLWKKKMNQIVLIGLCSAMTILMYCNVFQFRYCDKAGKTVTGYQAVSELKANEDALAGAMTEEMLTAFIKDFQKVGNNPENLEPEIEPDSEKPTGAMKIKSEIYYQYFYPKKTFTNMLIMHYKNRITGKYVDLEDFPIENGAQFYETRQKNIETILEYGDSSWQYSDAEKAYWLKQASGTKTPYVFGYKEGWMQLLDCVEFVIIPILSIIFLLSSMYVGEYECGADQIILTTKYGKSKIIIAKNIAAFLYASMVYFINVGIMYMVLLGSYGADGWNLPIQIAYTTIPYPFNFAQATFISFAAGYVIMIFLSCITLYLSARMRRSIAVLGIMLVLFFFPVFMKYSVTNGWYNQILEMLPYKAISHGLYMLLSYRFGELIFSYVSFRFVIYTVLSAIVIPMIGRGFKRHQTI